MSRLTDLSSAMNERNYDSQMNLKFTRRNQVSFAHLMLSKVFLSHRKTRIWKMRGGICQTCPNYPRDA